MNGLKKLNIGVIGCGMAWNRLHLPAVNRLKDNYSIVALADVNETSLNYSSEKVNLNKENLYLDYKDMLKRSDIDVVVVAVPIHLNYEVARDVAMAKKSMICEKPIGETLEECTKFLKLEEEFGVRILVAENFRHDEENNIIKQLIADRKLGEPIYFIKNYIINFPELMKEDGFSAKEWRQHPNFKLGLFLDNCVHELASIRYIFGGVEKLCAFGEGTDKEYTPYTSIQTLLKFQCGANGYFSFWCEGSEKQKPKIGFRIFCTNGSIYLEDKYCGCIEVHHNNGKEEKIAFTPRQGYYNEFLNFYNAIVKDERIKTTPAIEFGDTKLVFDIINSIEKEAVINVDDGTKTILQKTYINCNDN